jgi:hypothetical protein
MADIISVHGMVAQVGMALAVPGQPQAQAHVPVVAQQIAGPQHPQQLVQAVGAMRIADVEMDLPSYKMDAKPRGKGSLDSILCTTMYYYVLITGLLVCSRYLQISNINSGCVQTIS